MGKKKISNWKDCRDAGKVISFVESNPKFQTFEGTNHKGFKNIETNEKMFIPRHNGDLSPGVARNIFMFLVKAGVIGVALFIFLRWYII